MVRTVDGGARLQRNACAGGVVCGGGERKPVTARRSGRVKTAGDAAATRRSERVLEASGGAVRMRKQTAVPSSTAASY